VSVELRLVPISEEQEFGTIARWHKREGESVSAGEVILEVEACEGDPEVEAPVSGVRNRSSRRGRRDPVGD